MTTYAPPAPPFIQARHFGGKQTPKAIVMHGTVSPDDAGTARKIALWWKGPTSPDTSAHYVVDPREVIQCVGDHTVAYHCGHNTGTLGVEMCDEQKGPASRWSDVDSTAIIKRSARLVAELCLAYGIEPIRPSVDDLRRKGPHGIYGHNDSRLAFGNTTHSDPIDFPWDVFLRLVRTEISKIKYGEVPLPTGPKPQPAPPAPKGAPKPARFPRFYHTDNYVRHDSAVGIAEGAAKGFKSIDLDFHVSLDGHWVLGHWGDMRGYTFAGGKKPTGKVEDHTWTYLEDLRSQYGAILNGWEAIHLAKAKGYTFIEVECKATPDVDAFRTLRKIAQHAGIEIVVKRLTTVPGWNTCLRNAKAAGLKTMVLPRGQVTGSVKAWAYVDYVRQGGRNKITWV